MPKCRHTALCKATPDGVFTVSIESPLFDESVANVEVPPESFRQLLGALEELQTAVRQIMQASGIAEAH